MPLFRFVIMALLLSSAGFLAACQSAGSGVRDDARTAAEHENPIYRLDSGDKLRVNVFNEDTISGEYEVDGSGNIAVKLVGTVLAKNKTLAELSHDIEERLKEGYLKNPQVSIDVLNYRPFYVLGEVKEPGKYAFVNGMTVLNAIALAGGYTYRATENNVIVVRGNDSEHKEHRVDENSAVMPGDIIRVPERFF